MFFIDTVSGGWENLVSRVVRSSNIRNVGVRVEPDPGINHLEKWDLSCPGGHKQGLRDRALSTPEQLWVKAHNLRSPICPEKPVHSKMLA